MNAAARLFNQGALSRGWVVSVMLARAQYILYFLTICALVSALSVVYVTNASRSLNAGIHHTFVERNRLHTEWGQLLLEKSTLLTQARIQNKAEVELSMVVPDNKSVVIVNE